MERDSLQANKHAAIRAFDEPACVGDCVCRDEKSGHALFLWSSLSTVSGACVHVYFMMDPHLSSQSCWLTEFKEGRAFCLCARAQSFEYMVNICRGVTQICQPTLLNKKMEKK